MATNALSTRWVRFEDDTEIGTAFERAALAGAFLVKRFPEIMFRPSMVKVAGVDTPVITIAHQNRGLLAVVHAAMLACGSTRVDHIPHPLR